MDRMKKQQDIWINYLEYRYKKDVAQFKESRKDKPDWEKVARMRKNIKWALRIETRASYMYKGKMQCWDWPWRETGFKSYEESMAEIRRHYPVEGEKKYKN